MKSLILATLAGSVLALGAPAYAEHHEEPKAEVVEKDAKGTPTKVKIGDTIYDVCTAEKQDGCINPKAAGLKFGNTPLNYWPGKPASEIDHPLPAEKPE